MKRLLALLALLPVLLLLTACGSKQDAVSGPAQKLSVMLDFFPNADHVGLYSGLKRGTFRQAGLDLQILEPPAPDAPLKLLAAGKVDLAISYEPEVLLARDQDTPLISVGALVSRPLTSLMALPGAKIRTPADLKGKTVGTAGIPYQPAYLKTIGQRSGAGAIQQVDVGFNLNRALISKRVDATLGGFSNYEAIQLRQAGRKPVVIPVDQAGVPPYDELVVVARRKFLADHGDAVRSFVQALGRATAAVRANPERGVDDLVSSVPALRSQRKLQETAVRATLPAFAPPPGRPFGFQDPVEWRRYGRWMLSNRLVKHDPHAQDALTNEFLAGEGL